MTFFEDEMIHLCRNDKIESKVYAKNDYAIYHLSTKKIKHREKDEMNLQISTISLFSTLILAVRIFIS